MIKPIALQDSRLGEIYRVSLPCWVGRSAEAELSLSDRTLSLERQTTSYGFRIRSTLCAALMYRHQIYGLICLDHDVPGAYHQGDLTFLKRLASILAPIIENSRLWSDLKKQYSSVIKSRRVKKIITLKV